MKLEELPELLEKTAEDPNFREHYKTMLVTVLDQILSLATRMRRDSREFNYFASVVQQLAFAIGAETEDDVIDGMRLAHMSALAAVRESTEDLEKYCKRLVSAGRPIQAIVVIKKRLGLDLRHATIWLEDHTTYRSKNPNLRSEQV